MNALFIIGIAGGSASGKTTFCRALAEALDGYNIEAFHMDDYFNDEVPKSKAPITGKIYDDYNNPDAIDLPRLIDDLSAAQEDIVIVEGLFTLADEDIYRQLDLKLYIDCQADERIVRRLKRYQEGRYIHEDWHYLCKDEYGQLLKPDYVSAQHKALLEKHRMPHIAFTICGIAAQRCCCLRRCHWKNQGMAGSRRHQDDAAVCAYECERCQK